MLLIKLKRKKIFKNSGKKFWKKLTLNRLLEFIKILILNEYKYEKVKNNIWFTIQ